MLLSAKAAAELDLGKLSGKKLIRFFVADPHEIDPGYKLWIPSASIVPVIRILKHLVPFYETGHPPTSIEPSISLPAGGALGRRNREVQDKESAGLRFVVCDSFRCNRLKIGLNFRLVRGICG
jgi:hypothetical protein